MGLREHLFSSVIQPTTPEINWSDPITAGLVGLIWCGSDGGRDLVTQSYPLNSLGMSRVLTPTGVGSYKSVGSSGFYSPRANYGQWKIESAPITLAVFADYTTPATTLTMAGIAGGPGGYAIGVRYGVRYNNAYAWVGGTSRSIEGANSSTGPNVYSMTATDSRIAGYDGGKLYSALTYSGAGTLTYDPTFCSLLCGGSGDNPGPNGTYYWSAAWSRELSPDEHLRLAREPWCLFRPGSTFTVGSAAALLGGATAIDLTSSSFRPRVNILSLPP